MNGVFGILYRGAYSDDNIPTDGHCCFVQIVEWYAVRRYVVFGCDMCRTVLGDLKMIFYVQE